MSDTEKSVIEFDASMKALRSFREFEPFERFLKEQISRGIDKMLKGRKEETMKEMAREVKVYQTILNLFYKS
jgi:hypothetical protein